MKKFGVLACASVAGLAAACATQPEAELDAPEPAVEQPATFAEAADERVFFAFDQSALNDMAKETLRAQAAWLNLAENADVSVTIEGNADERGTREYNLVLGRKRAEAVEDFLVALGVDPARISTVTYGEERPIDPASNEEAWAVNRNATSVLIFAGS